MPTNSVSCRQELNSHLEKAYLFDGLTIFAIEHLSMNL